jgi:hypothetical protein
MKSVGIVVLVVLLFGLVVLGTRHWILTLQRISREETDPKERRKWWLRAFLLRLIGVLWYEDHRRKTDAAP